MKAHALTFALAWGACASLSGCKGGHGGVQAVLPQGAFQPGSANFDPLPVGDQEALSVTFENVSASDTELGIGSPAITGDFALLTPLPATLAAGGSVALRVQFLPTAVGMRSGTLTVPTSGAESPQVVLALQGQGVSDTGIQLQVSPLALDFGTLLLGEALSEKVQIYNPNTFDVGALLALAETDPRAQFSLAASGLSASGDGGVTEVVKGQQSVTVDVAFAPSLSQASTAALSVAACPTCPATAVALKGTGIDAHLSFDPPHLDFGFVLNAVNPPPALPVTVFNTGNLPLTLVGIAVPHNSPFQLLKPPAPDDLLSPDAGGVPFSVSYSPSGAPSDRLDIVATWSVLPPGASVPVVRTTYLPVYGNQSLGGCQPFVIQDGGLDFGRLSAGDSLTEDLQILNAGGADCTLAVQLDPTSSASFTLQAPAQGGGSFDGGWLVAAHGETQFPVTFATAPDTHHLAYRGLVRVGGIDGGPSLNVPLNAALASGYAPGSYWPKWGHDNGNSGQGDLDTSKTLGSLRWRTLMTTVPPDTLGIVVQDAGDGNYQTAAGPDYAGTGPGVSLAPYAPWVGETNVGPVIGDDGSVLQLGGPYWQSLWGLEPADGGVTSWYPIGSFNNQPVAHYSTDQSLLGVSSPVVAQNGLVAVNVALRGDYGLDEDGPLFYISSQSQTSIVFSSILTNSPPVFTPGTIEFVDANYDQTCWYSLALQTTNPSTTIPCFRGSLATGGLPSPALDALNRSYWCGQGALAHASLAVPNGCAQVVGNQTRLGWSVDFGSAFVGAPALGFGQMFVDTFQEGLVNLPGRQESLQYQSTIYSLDPDTGATNWSYQLPVLPVPPTGRAPVLDAGIPGIAFNPDYFSGREFHLALGDDGALIVAYVDGIYCLEASGPNQGTLRWKVAVDGGSLGTASLGLDGTAYIGTIRQGLLAIDSKTGTVRWSFRLPASDPAALDSNGLLVQSITARPAVGEQVIYFAGDDNYVYAIQ